MKERFKRLYTLPKNLYEEGAPVMISAGALLMDNETGAILAQLKFRNIQNKVIKALKVAITMQDVAGRNLGIVGHQYLDWSAGRGKEFASKEAVVLTNPTTRNFLVCVTEVVFADNTMWTSEPSEWLPIHQFATLNDYFQDEELRKEYSLLYGKEREYIPFMEKDIWLCSCGHINHQEEVRCYHCDCTYKEVEKTLDIATLSKLKIDRIAKEEEAKQVEAQQREEKRRKATALFKRIVVVTAALVAVSVILVKVVPMSRINIWREKYGNEEVTISAGSYDTIALTSDGTIISTEQGRTDIPEWKNVISLSAGRNHNLGLCSDGTVVAYGNNSFGQCNVSAWDEIVAVKAGVFYSVGLRADGTVVAVGNNTYNKCDTDEWQGIVAIDAGETHTVGLKQNGTVVAIGNNNEGQCDVDTWRDIIAVAAGHSVTVGLKKDGTVVATGDDDLGVCEVSSWKNIIAVDTGYYRTVGLRADGTIAITPCTVEDGQDAVTEWTDIVAISVGNSHIAGLKNDGTILAVGNFDDDVLDWKDIKLPEK